MNSPSKRFFFDLANPDDSAEILEILEEDDFSGQIALQYTRRPDPYHSLNLEGQDTAIVVCRDRETGSIAGFGACTTRMLYVNREPTRTGYLFGLRVRRQYRRVFPLLARGYEAMRTAIHSENIPCFLTTILTENTYAQRVLEKPRSFMPYYSFLAGYETSIIKTGLGFRDRRYSLKRLDSTSLVSAIDFINQWGRLRQFYPVLTKEAVLGGEYAGLNPEDFYALVERDEIVACGAVWRQKSYKQYVLKGYGGVLKALRPLSAVFPAFGYPALPKPGSELNFFTLSFWAAKDWRPGLLGSLIGAVSAVRRESPFFVLGLSSGDPMRAAIDGIPHISYQSRAYLVDWDKKGNAALDKGSPVYLECGML